MASPRDRSAILRLTPEQMNRSELLIGLEFWLHLALLSDQQVLAFCQTYLTCPLPLAIAEPAEKKIAASATVPSPVLAAVASSDFANASASPVSPLPSSPHPAKPNSLAQAIRSFMAEVSIIWLLILGVFMVVVSSGVLAATQWQNFSAIGQYGILLAYTIAFAAASLWTARQENLRLTSRMLQLATLLIIPVNFWMMDGLRVGSSGVGVALSAIAALSLTAILLRLLQMRSGLAADRFRLIAINSVGLSWLHWGWGWAGVPLIATYLGTVGTAVLLWKQSQLKVESASRPSADEGSAIVPVLPSQDSPLSHVVIILAALLLIGRALLAAQVPVDQLGLALGLCGWVLGWLNRRDQRAIWRWAGGGLLLLGWLVSIAANPPWQAIAVSSLGLWLLVNHLQAQLIPAQIMPAQIMPAQITAAQLVPAPQPQAKSHLPTLVAIFGVGLQTYVALWRLLPESGRQQIISSAMQLAGDRGMPEVLLGLGAFPYIVLALGMAARLRRRAVAEPDFAAHGSRLAHQTEALALILGIGLTLVSWENLLLRSLNLTLSTLALLWVCRHRRAPLPLLYLTQITAIVGVFCWIEVLFPGLSDLAHARILLGGMAIEWFFSQGSRRWQRSAWHLGLVLAGCGYLLLLPRILEPDTAYENLIGLLIPLGLTGLACSHRLPSRRWAAWLSAALLMAQLLLLNQLNAGLISLGVATVLMLVNTRLLRQRVAACLTVGFALSFEAVAIALQPQVTGTVVWNLLAANLWILWLLRGSLLRGRRPPHASERPVSEQPVSEQPVSEQPVSEQPVSTRQISGQPTLPELYAFAVNIWAIALCSLTLLLLTVLCWFEPTGGVATAAGLTIGAIAYRIGQQPTNLGFGGMAWGAEILAIALVQLGQGDITAMAIATLGLGLFTQLAGDFWVRRSAQPYRFSWHGIPLGYAGLGWLMGHSVFAATTGLYTLAAALIGMGVGRRSPRLKAFSFLSVLLISFAAYELLIYQLLQAKGGEPGDGVILLAGLAALIAIAHQLLGRWLVPYLHLTAAELRSIAHLHWGLGSGLALLAPFLNLSDPGAGWELVVVGALAGYALAMGRTAQVNAAADATPDLSWTYAGIWQAIAALSYVLYRWFPEAVGWAGAIASLLALGLYGLPWQRWGWSGRPGQKTAILLPGLVVLVTTATVTLQSLLITAACYAWFAQSTRRVRLSYISILLLDWALLRYLNQQGWLTLLGFSLIFGGSLLYVAQIDPTLQTAAARPQRHGMRSIATGLISLAAFYQAEIETGAAAWVMGGLALGLGLGLVFLGIILRVRAFLYVGTVAFMLRILRLLWLFIYTYSALLWASGIVLGLLLIWTAATFEARRSQVNALVQYWVTELEDWE